MSQSAPFDADVAIVGYGPSGVSAANFLGAYGVKAMAFERDKDIYPRARAVTVNDWTLRCYQSVGLDQDLIAGMDETVALRWKTYDGKELMRSTFKNSTMGHPASMAIYQPVMEETLRRGAERFANNVSVRFGENVTGISQDGDGVTLTVTDSAGVEKQMRFRYVLACDGGASGVRTQLGIKLIGSTVDTRWVVIDARVKRWWPERNILTFWSDKKRPVVDIALSMGNHRWEFPLEPHESEDDFKTHEQLWRLLNELGVTRDQVEIHQHAFYKHHVRHAERWRDGRVFLIGDAAHLMPPWAGQGMQSGVRDAFNICWKLREVLAGRLPDAVLDTYEPERAPNVALFTGFSERLGRIIKMQMTPEEKRMMAIGAVVSKLGVKPPPSPLTQPPTIETGWLRGPTGTSSAVGKMPPQPRVSNSRGRQCKLDDLLGSGFVLLGARRDPASVLSAQDKAGWDKLGAQYIAVRGVDEFSQAENDIVDVDGALLSWMSDKGANVIALRPDRFVAASDASGIAVPAA